MASPSLPYCKGLPDVWLVFPVPDNIDARYVIIFGKPPVNILYLSERFSGWRVCCILLGACFVVRSAGGWIGTFDRIRCERQKDFNPSSVSALLFYSTFIWRPPVKYWGQSDRLLSWNVTQLLAIQINCNSISVVLVVRFPAKRDIFFRDDFFN